MKIVTTVTIHSDNPLHPLSETMSNVQHVVTDGRSLSQITEQAVNYAMYDAEAMVADLRFSSVIEDDERAREQARGKR